ncbi:MAG: hypothetical protein AUK47_13085 [Deltaproteobacteria bacterium CG2_30_63_29]|nr:MAG: hypothetical protein AUK47_13085 [Deltaproteobacteria bacterium CG2_30_63_29]PJB42588.1 MAG: hypothetical protein CO108_11410 [Deltaproteobacteria bacterium CG_4_9_14_3_um_filter_63_12]
MEAESNGPKILVIEDDKRLLRALSYFLTQKGMNVAEGTDGADALQVYLAHRPDLLIIDNSLPNKMGYEICKEVRAAGGENLPIIMISAFMKVLGVDGAEAEEDHLVDAFLRKPFQLNQLWNVLSDLKTEDGFERPQVKDKASQTVSGRPGEVTNFGIPVEGSCEETPFIEILSIALTNQATGILTLKEDNRVRRLYLANGFPAFARSNLISENLLRYLLRIGEITADTYRTHLAKMQQERWRPGAILVREGAISLTRLNRSHRLLVEEIIQICINWSRAAFEFRPSLVPIEQAVVYDINPFKIVDRWLERHFTSSQLIDRLQPIILGELRCTEHFASWRHMLEWALSLDTEFETNLKLSVACIDLMDIPEERRALRARLLQSFLLLGAIQLHDPSRRLLQSPEKAVRALMRPPVEEEAERERSQKMLQAVPDTPPPPPISKIEIVQPDVKKTSSDVKDKRSDEQLRRIYDVVLRDYRRVLDRTSPFEVLRVSSNDNLDVIRRRYERFERFYRPENFQRLGDSKLYQLAIEIRQALARAMAEIEAGVSSSPGISNMNANVSFGRGLSWFEPETSDPLAQIFFNDGLTYLRISDFEESASHFQRSIELEPQNGMFKTYLVWTAFLKGDRTQQAAETARRDLEELLLAYPEEDTVYHFLAHIHREEGNLELAVSFYRKAAEINPDNRSARLFLQRLSGLHD